MANDPNPDDVSPPVVDAGYGCTATPADPDAWRRAQRERLAAEYDALCYGIIERGDNPWAR